MKRYFQLMTDGKSADLDIYGDICETWWDDDTSVSASALSKQLDELGDVEQINVHINSYGGEVAEGLAIYNALRRHNAKIRTTCDGFACSIASVVFMAGDERLMSSASLLMIHNAFTSAWGANANDLRKLADDMDIITQASKNAYLSRASIDEEELTALMDAETWITPADAVDMGFATGVEQFEESGNPSQSVRASLVGIVSESARMKAEDGDDVDEETDLGEEPEEEPEDGGGEEPDGDDGEDSPEDPEDPEDPDAEDGAAKQSSRGFAAFLKSVTAPGTVIINN